jgi:hypothetical protein
MEGGIAMTTIEDIRDIPDRFDCPCHLLLNSEKSLLETDDNFRENHEQEFMMFSARCGS